MNALIPTLLAAALLPLNSALAEETIPTDAITAQCTATETGDEAIAACVGEESTAWELIAGHKTEHNDEVTRCEKTLEDAKYAQIESCVTADIEAVSQIAELDPVHQGIVSDCQQRHETRGAAMVLACSNQEIEVADSIANMSLEDMEAMEAEAPTKTETN